MEKIYHIPAFPGYAIAKCGKYLPYGKPYKNHKFVKDWKRVNCANCRRCKI